MICRICDTLKDSNCFQKYKNSSGNISVRKVCKTCRLGQRKPETVRANALRAYYKKKKIEPEAVNLKQRLYRARRRLEGRPIIRNCISDKFRKTGRFKFWIRAEVFRLKGSKCVYCGNDDNMQIDHIVPLARGGTDDISNLVPCCRSCNSSKQDKPVSQWLQSKTGGYFYRN